MSEKKHQKEQFQVYCGNGLRHLLLAGLCVYKKAMCTHYYGVKVFWDRNMYITQWY